MKRIIAVFINICMVIGLLVFPASAEKMAYNYATVYINGEILKSDTPAIIIQENGRTLVPLRAICEALKCEVTWHEDEKRAQIQNEVTIISVMLNYDYLTKIDIKDKYEKKTQEIKLDMRPIFWEEKMRIMVPLRAIADALHADIQWNAENRSVYITLEYDYISNFNDYRLAEVKKDQKYGYINESREAVVDVVYDSVGGFSDGYAVAKKNGKWGYVNTDGNVIVPFVYDIVWGFSDGLAIVGKNKKYGYINKSGEEVVPVIYDIADNFTDGLARVMNNGKWGYINAEGNVVIPIIYDKADRFLNGMASVEKNAEAYNIDKTGKKIVDR